VRRLYPALGDLSFALDVCSLFGHVLVVLGRLLLVPGQVGTSLVSGRLLLGGGEPVCFVRRLFVHPLRGIGLIGWHRAVIAHEVLLLDR
jgi:hypothetical protein